ncbi:hypothetical protein BDN67DRAFT_250704, partial [Paxillus ammoniavirescens]
MQRAASRVHRRIPSPITVQYNCPFSSSACVAPAHIPSVIHSLRPFLFLSILNFPMEKVQELWTPQSVTTTFKFPQFPLPPPKRLSQVSTICNRFCGPGWVLALTTVGSRYQTLPKTYRLEFRARVTRPSLGATLQATLSRSRESGAAAVAFAEQKITLQGPLQSEVVTVLWSSTDLDEISDADVILMITITGSNTLFGIVSSFFTFPPSTPAASPSPRCPPSISNSAQVLRVLDQSLGDGISFDVKFLTNSKRLCSGHIYKPLPTYAHSAVLEEVCPKLDTRERSPT